MAKRYSNEDWRKAARRLNNLAVVKVNAPIFACQTADDVGELIGYETEILETLAEAQEEGVRYLVFVHPTIRRRKGATTGPAVLRWLTTRAPWTWDYVKRVSVKYFDGATLVEIRLPAPTEDAYHRHYDGLSAPARSAPTG
ncbi:MAG: hypothetical protein M0D54_02425 [Hyphomonadaceae bacterium JAD_PAG50586_4]|nr:MAG: hypothetical protein M0D54_02425 [Hyphomonadaceae bacterium JAD_PAG50586_4]